VTFTCLPFDSRLIQKDPFKERPMNVPRLSRHPSILRGALSRWSLTFALASLAACATHRGQPPQCKGPFTPINQSSSVVSNGSQR
jgi:hypothetical protein